MMRGCSVSHFVGWYRYYSVLCFCVCFFDCYLIVCVLVFSVTAGYLVMNVIGVFAKRLIG